MIEHFTNPLNVLCPQLAKQPEGSSCNKNNKCRYPECLVAGKKNLGDSKRGGSKNKKAEEINPRSSH